MAMDVLRYTYRSKMRLSATSTEETEVEWFRCDKAAKPFSEPHVFGSSVWWNEKDKPAGPGEVYARPYRWHKNINRSPGVFIGSHSCGPVEAFKGGSSVSDKTLRLLPDIVPADCANLVRFTLKLGPGFLCGSCLDFPLRWTATGQTYGGPSTLVLVGNGFGDCQWARPGTDLGPDTGADNLFRSGFLGGWWYTYEDHGTNYTSDVIPDASFHCNAPNTFTFTNTTPPFPSPTGPPVTITPL